MFDFSLDARRARVVMQAFPFATWARGVHRFAAVRAHGQAVGFLIDRTHRAEIVGSDARAGDVPAVIARDGDDRPRDSVALMGFEYRVNSASWQMLKNDSWRIVAAVMVVLFVMVRISLQGIGVTGLPCFAGRTVCVLADSGKNWQDRFA